MLLKRKKEKRTFKLSLLNCIFVLSVLYPGAKPLIQGTRFTKRVNKRSDIMKALHSLIKVALASFTVRKAILPYIITQRLMALFFELLLK